MAAATERRPSKPSLANLLESFNVAKDCLESYLSESPRPNADLSNFSSKNANNWLRQLKRLYNTYASEAKLLISFYSRNGCPEELNDIFEDKTAQKNEVDMVIHYVNSIISNYNYENGSDASGAASCISSLSSTSVASRHPDPSDLSESSGSTFHTIDKWIEQKPEVASETNTSQPSTTTKRVRFDDSVTEHILDDLQNLNFQEDSNLNTDVYSNNPDFVNTMQATRFTTPKNVINSSPFPAFSKPNNVSDFSTPTPVPAFNDIRNCHAYKPSNSVPLNPASQVFNPSHPNPAPQRTVGRDPQVFLPNAAPYVSSNNVPYTSLNNAHPHLNPPQYAPYPQDAASLQLIKQDLFKKPAKPFNGDVSDFMIWYPTILNMMRGIRLTSLDQLLILQAHTEGEPQKMIRGKIASAGAFPEYALQECWETLRRDYGSGSQVAEDLINKVETTPPIKSIHQIDKLKELLELCKLINCNMAITKELSFFDMSMGIKKIFLKLPESMQNSWREQEMIHQQRTGESAPLHVFLNFLERKIATFSLPAYRKAALKNETETPRKKFNTPAPPKFATYQVAKDEPQTSHPVGNVQIDTSIKCVIHPEMNHSILKCYEFRNMPFNEKRKVCFNKGLCYLCLGKHRQSDCNSSVSCEKCNYKHITLMHKDNGQRVSNVSHDDKADSKISLCTKLCNDASSFKNCSKTVLVRITRPGISNQTLECYCIIDEQSTSSFADRRVAEFFNITGPIVNYNLNTLSGTNYNTEGIEMSGLFVKGVNEKKGFKLPLLITNDSLPQNKHEIASPDIVLAHPHISYLAKHFNPINDSAEVLLLLSRDCDKAMFTKAYGHKAPYAHHTNLGWALVGATCQVSDVNSKVATVLRTSIDHDHFSKENSFLDPVVKFHDVYDIFAEQHNDEFTCLSKDDQQFLDIVNGGIKSTPIGNISMPLPFKYDKVKLPDNKLAVFNRSQNTLHRLKKDPFKLEQSISTMQKYLNANHVEELVDSPGDSNSNCWYIPVFPVTHPKKKKVRLVFDSSAKYNGTSLNQQLLQGPDVTTGLRTVINRFRLYPVAFSADVEGMFHNFLLEPQDRDFTRFFWFTQNNPEKPLTEFRATRHVFGNTSSPALANIGLRYAIMNASPEPSSASKDFVFNHFYVDDGLASSPTVQGAVDVLKETMNSLQQFNIRLCKVASNSSYVVESFPETERCVSSDPVSITESALQTTLGVKWDTISDEFIIETSVPERPFTKRGVLSTINSTYDPAGFISPIIFAGRIFQRKILTSKCNPNPLTDSLDWDDPLPNSYMDMWTTWKTSLRSSSGFRVPRCYIPHDFGIPTQCELHGFSDASLEGTGYVIYMKSYQSERIHVSFVCGNSRVAPRLATSIPRLELCAALDVSIAIADVARTLEIPINCVYLYSDSNVVLGWLRNRTNRFSMYVARRVNIILKLFEVSQWQYVSTEENPADIASRPQTHESLVKSIWLTGPNRLWLPTSDVINEPIPIDNSALPEIKSNTTVLVAKRSATPSLVNTLYDQVSSYERVIRFAQVLASFAMYFIAKYRQQTRIPVTLDSFIVPKVSAINMLIRSAQSVSFSDTIKQLKTDPNCNLRDSSILNLSPFLDDQQILRVGGRLGNSLIPVNVKHPILLSDTHPLSKLIVNHYHVKIKHQGRTITLAAIRNAGYFIHHGSTLIRKIINDCVICRKLRGPFLNQMMSDLPYDRLEETPPFSNTGIDVFGPYRITDGRATRKNSSEKKTWAVIFSCLVSRATHIEPLPAMDTSSFINALRRFFAIRGTCKVIRSDRGTNFVGALNQNCNISVAKINEHIKSSECTWELNPAKASHFGGAWERKIGSIKSVLNSSLLAFGSRLPTRDELHTFFQEAAAILNNTPLCPILNDPNEPFPITPAMLLTLKDSPNPAQPETFNETDLMAYGQRRWRRIQHISSEFFRRWRSEYIHNLTERNKWLHRKRAIAVGDIVLMKDAAVKRNQWPIGRVTIVHRSKDDHIRSVTLQLSSSSGTSRILTRPITELVLLTPGSNEGK